MLDTKEYIEWKKTHSRFAPKVYKRHLDRVDKIDTMDDYINLRQKLEGELSPSTIRMFNTVLRDYLNYCTYTNQPKLNPKLIKVQRGASDFEREVPTKTEVVKMISVCDMIRDKAVIMMLADTGVRAAELISLKISDLNFDAIPESGIEKNTAVIQNKKNGSKRTIMWTDETKNLLLQIICNCKLEDKLFSITTRTIERIVENARVRAGIKRQICPHSFRHYKSKNMFMNGADLKSIQIMLGHKNDNLSSVNTYIRVGRVEQNEILSRYIGYSKL